MPGDRVSEIETEKHIDTETDRERQRWTEIVRGIDQKVKTHKSEARAALD